MVFSMKRLTLGIAASLLALAAFSPGKAQIIPKQEDLTHHDFTAYEKKVWDAVTTFHKNFNAHEWAKNGPLVTADMQVDSNGTEVNGRDAFVARIARFAGPFPDVQIHDLDTSVDGNYAVVRFLITGTQKGDFATPAGVIKASNKTIHVDGVEIFTFDKDAKVKRLITIERLDQLIAQLKS